MLKPLLVSSLNPVFISYHLREKGKWVLFPAKSLAINPNHNLFGYFVLHILHFMAVKVKLFLKSIVNWTCVEF